LTQEQLGRRLGLKGRAIYRWERGDANPTRRNRAALVTAIAAVNMDLARHLKDVLIPSAPSATPPAAAPPPVDKEALFDVTLYRMADELDLPARRVRGPLARLLRAMVGAELPLPVALQQLEARIAQG